jgi:DNA repair protein RecN (Recombination protein N)
MLQKLIIRNYAIIDHLTIEPNQSFNTVTGETGAGKSIILGALSLILGERADTSVLINKNDKCVIEAYFEVSDNEAFKSAIKEAELDEDDICIIRREISSNGKSRAFINDTPVTLSLLNKITSLLVDLHQQFGHLALEDNHFQMEVIDAIAQNDSELKAYHQLFRSYKKTESELAQLKEKQAQWQKESDYKQFLYDELSEADFKEQEIEEAAQQLKQLNNAEKIISVLQNSHMALEEGEQPIVNELKKIAQQLQSVSDVMSEAASLQERCLSMHAELKDIAAELSFLENKVNLDPALVLSLQDRVDLGYKLCKKHGVQTTAELLDIWKELATSLESSLNLSEAIERLEKTRDDIYKQLLAEAKKLSEKRIATAPGFSSRMNGLLQLVGMPNASLKIEISKLPKPDAYGTDRINFLLDANKSGQFLPVYKAASGGEMSRIMLCIKSLTAKAMHLPTLIFDEVDTGISGEAARQVGILLNDLGRHHQIICITHQPQVAAKGAQHFFVYKDLDANNRITTKVRVLKNEERIQVIAQMIGGETPSEAALQNARELVAV